MEQDYGYQVVSLEGVQIEYEIPLLGKHSFKENLSNTKPPFVDDIEIHCKFDYYRAGLNHYDYIKIQYYADNGHIQFHYDDDPGYTEIYTGKFKTKDLEIDIKSFDTDLDKENFKKLYSYFFEY